MVILYQFSHLLFWSVAIFLAVNLLLIVGLMRPIVRLNARSTGLSRESGTTFVEALNSLRSIRTLHGEKFVMEAYSAQIRSYVRMLVQIDAIKSGVKAFPAIVLLFFGAVALRPGAELNMADAALFAGTIIIIRVFASLGQMVAAGMQIITDMRAVGDIGALLNIARESTGVQATDLQEPIHDLTLRQVCFGYGGRGIVLQGVSFAFTAGRTYAIVGSSGSGKSTLADIVLGLTTPDSGTVQVNSGKISMDAARSRFMLVEQQPKIFSSSVKDNLLMGLSASEDELYEVLEIVNLAEVVTSLAQGLETRLTYLGENFSGGQRQRLGIARALLRNPDVLILDEATSALDPETRIQVVDKLRKRMGHGIIIFITHDEEIAALADEVLKIERGATA
jgi:ATP-binding cassette subfamily B protein